MAADEGVFDYFAYAGGEGVNPALLPEIDTKPLSLRKFGTFRVDPDIERFGGKFGDDSMAAVVVLVDDIEMLALRDFRRRVNRLVFRRLTETQFEPQRGNGFFGNYVFFDQSLGGGIEGIVVGYDRVFTGFPPGIDFAISSSTSISNAERLRFSILSRKRLSA